MLHYITQSIYYPFISHSNNKSCLMQFYILVANNSENICLSNYQWCGKMADIIATTSTRKTSPMNLSVKCVWNWKGNWSCNRTKLDLTDSNYYKEDYQKVNKYSWTLITSKQLIK